MKTALAMLAIIAATCLLGVAALSKDQAEPSARSWLALIDSEKYDQSWSEASAMFQNGVKQQDWAQMAKGVRVPLGAVVSRTLLKVTMANSLPGAPDGEYAVIQFNTAFKNKVKAVETITMAADGGKWKAAGYFIK